MCHSPVKIKADTFPISNEPVITISSGYSEEVFEVGMYWVEEFVFKTSNR